jgi:nitrite reductase/ring-hydroxylating ferredoxin subunit
MSEFVPVVGCEELPAGSMRAFTVEGRRVAVYHTRRGFFATDNTCPHRGGPLAEGDLLGDEVVCPWHLWGFNVESGCNDRFPEMVVAVHEVKIENATVYVRLSEPKKD